MDNKSDQGSKNNLKGFFSFKKRKRSSKSCSYCLQASINVYLNFDSYLEVNVNDGICVDGDFHETCNSDAMIIYHLGALR